jgi:hypothetical protein
VAISGGSDGSLTTASHSISVPPFVRGAGLAAHSRYEPFSRLFFLLRVHKAAFAIRELESCHTGSREVEPARHFNSFAQGATISGPLWRKGIFASASHPYLIAMPRRFPPPWEIDDNGACFMVKDASGRRAAANLGAVRL